MPDVWETLIDSTDNTMPLKVLADFVRNVPGVVPAYVEVDGTRHLLQGARLCTDRFGDTEVVLTAGPEVG